MVEAQWLMQIAQRRIEALDASQMRLASVVRSIDESTKSRIGGENEGDAKNSIDRREHDKENCFQHPQHFGRGNGDDSVSHCRAGPVLAVLPQKPRGKRHSVSDKAQTATTPEKGEKKRSGAAHAMGAKTTQVGTNTYVFAYINS